MTREEMIKEMKKLDFRIVWPLVPEWDEDIGFTEREIYVNSKGYGYYACDESNGRWKLDPIPEKKWEEIREKIVSKSLCYEDILDTSLIDLEWWIEDYKYNSEELSSSLAGLTKLSKRPTSSFFCSNVSEELEFFLSMKELVHAMEKRGCDNSWDEISEEELSRWVSRLRSGKLEWDW